MTKEELGRLVHFIVQYVFENDDGNVDADFCLPEIAAGRCGRHGQEDEPNVEQCTQCLIRLFKERAATETAKHRSTN